MYIHNNKATPVSCCLFV